MPAAKSDNLLQRALLDLVVSWSAEILPSVGTSTSLPNMSEVVGGKVLLTDNSQKLHHVFIDARPVAFLTR